MKDILNKKKYIILILIFIVMAAGIAGITSIAYKNDKIIGKIKESYINEIDIDYEFLNNNLMKYPKNSDEYFIRGYIKNEIGKVSEAKEDFKIAFERINNETNKFTKYYLYKLKGENLLEKDNQSSIDYAKLALENLAINKYNDDYKLVWRTLKPYVKIEDGRVFIIDNIEKMLKKNTSEDIEYELKKILSSIYILIGENNLAIQTSLNVIDMAKDRDDAYEEAKSIVNIAVVFKSMGAYEMAIKMIDYAQKVDIPNDRMYEIDLYSYVQLCSIYINTEEYDLLYDNVQKIYNYRWLEEEPYYDDFLFYAKVDEGIWNLYKGDIEKCKSLLEEGLEILNRDNNNYISDKDIKINLAYGDLNSKIGNYNEAEKYYNVANQLVEERESYEYEYSIMKSLANLYKEKGDILNYEYQINKIDEFNLKNKNDIIISYLYANVKEYENIKSINEMYKEQFRNTAIIFFMIICSVIIGSVVFKKYRSLSYESSHDGMTGVYNRRSFNQEYNKLLDKNEKFSLLIFDVDNFKDINDTFGHEFGDVVLINICKVIKNLLQKEDKIYRYGGEEFVILIKNKDYEKASEIAENIRFRVEEMTWRENITITVSLGMSSSEEWKHKTLESADSNLYISKKMGKNRVTI